MNKFSINGIQGLDRYSNPELIPESKATELTNFIIKGNKVVRRESISVLNGATGYGIKRLIDNGSYLYGVADNRLYKSLNGTGIWDEITDSSVSNYNIRSAKMFDKLVCTNNVDDAFFVKDHIAYSLNVARPDLTGVSAAAVSDDTEARKLLADVILYKAVSNGTNIYGHSFGGTKIFKMDLDSNVIKEGEDNFDYIVSICTNFDKSKIYLLNLRATVYTLVELNLTTLNVEHEWTINLTPTYNLTDIHCTGNKVWIGASATYSTANPVAFMWNFDEPATTINNVTPVDKSFCITKTPSLNGTWVAESIIAPASKMFADGFQDDIIYILFKAYVVGGNTSNAIHLPLASNTQEITTGIAWVSEAHTGLATPFDAITSDVIPVTYNTSDTAWDVLEMQLVNDLANNVLYLMLDITLVYGIVGSINQEDGCIYYALTNTGAVSPYIDTLTQETLDISSFFGACTMVYGDERLYFFNSALTGLLGYMPSTVADLFDITDITYGTYNAVGANDYYYTLVYLTADGETSAPSHLFIVNALEIGTLNTVEFANLPVSADARVIQKKLYRTTKDGIAFYEVAIIDNTETTFTDNVPDADLDTSTQLEETIDNFKASAIISHKNRIFYGNVRAQDGTITASIPASASINIGAGTGVIGLEDGEHTYAFGLVNKEGAVSPLSIPYKVTTDSANRQVSIVLNLQSLRFNYDIVSINIYRTKTGGSAYYYRGTIPYSEDTIVYIDLLPDSTLTSLYTYKRRRNRLIWSSIDNTGTVSADNYFDIGEDESDTIMALADDVEGVIIFKQEGIYKLYTTGLQDGWTLRKIDEANCDNGSVVTYRGRHYFVYGSKIYRSDNTSVPISLALGNDLDGKTVTDLVYYEKENWLVANYGTFVTVYDEVNDCWYKFSVTGLTFDSIGKYNGSLVFLDNKLYYYNVGTGVLDLFNTPIETLLQSKVFVANKSTELIRLRKMLANYKKTDTVDVGLYIKDYDTAETLEYTDSVDAVNTTDYKSIKLVIENMTGTLKISNKVLFGITNAEEVSNIDVMFTTLHRNLR